MSICRTVFVICSQVKQTVFRTRDANSFINIMNLTK
uniref:Uncharacterized protein n=1 Tax=viral metagenome TaxID=1070528 RepID=A0A6C0K489_9ZZZZ